MDWVAHGIFMPHGLGLVVGSMIFFSETKLSDTGQQTLVKKAFLISLFLKDSRLAIRQNLHHY